MEYIVKNIEFCGTILHVLCVLTAVSNGETLIDYIEESCYGSDGFIDALQPRCSNDEVIYPRDVYTYSKRKSTLCPWISYSGVRNETYCCRYFDETEDCGMRYYGLSTGLEHYKPFTGRNSGLIQVAWNNTLNICNQTEYFEKTHYMRMTYNCIKASKTGSVCNSSLTGNSVYLWNDGYPDSDGGCSSTSGCECSIQSNGGSNIQIDALDLRFAINDTTGMCSQRLFFTDGTSESDIACDDVNLFERRTLFTSSSSSMQLRYDNTYTGSGGNFWILVKAIDSSQSLTVVCGAASVPIVEYGCGDNFTIITPMTTPTPETTENTEQISTATTSDIQSTKSSVIDDSTSATPMNPSSTTSSPLDGSSKTPPSTDGSSTLSPTSDVSASNSPLTSPGTGVTDKSVVEGEESESSESKSKGPIIGAIIGVVLALVAAGLIAYTIWRRKFKKTYQVEPEDYDEYFNDDSGVITSRPPERAATQIGQFHG